MPTDDAPRQAGGVRPRANGSWRRVVTRTATIQPRSRSVIPAAVWQAFLLGQVTVSRDPRWRWTPKYVLLCWVAMGWSVATIQPCAMNFQPSAADYQPLPVPSEHPRALGYEARQGSGAAAHATLSGAHLSLS